MFQAFSFFAFLLLVLVVVAFKSILTVKEGEYVTIFRLRKFHKVYGSGRIITIPFLDRVVRVPVNEILNWQTMPSDELEKKVADIALKM